MKSLLSFLSLFFTAIGSFAQSFTIDGLTYSVLSETDKTVELISGVEETGDVVIPAFVTIPASQVMETLWTTQSGPAWTTTVNDEGRTVYTSGSISDDEFTVLRCTFRTAGSITFMCRYQGEGGCDYLTIGDCDAPCTRDVYATTLQNSPGNWERIVVTPGDDNEHYIEFCYSKDGSVSNDPDCAEVYLAETQGGEYAVTSISSGLTFQNNTNITSFSAPSLTTIGNYMFSGCTGLSSIDLPSATSIGSSAFYSCTSLNSVSLPSATSIDEGAFDGCSNIISLRIGSTEQWFKVNFSGYRSNPLQYTLQHVDLYIGDSETPATSVELPSTVTEIPDYAFTNTTITSFSAPSVTSIGSSAFYGCFSLASAKLPSATSIGDCAFYGCSSLSSVSLPSATSIGNYAFIGCESLEEAIMPKVKSIGYYAFGHIDNYDENGNWTQLSCKSLAHVDLSSIKSIADEAFFCRNIKSLRIGSAEQWCKANFGSSYSNPLQDTSQQVDLYIGDSETPATSVELPSTVTEIPDYAFRNTTITSFSAPSVTSIGRDAFNNCSSLASASFPSATSIGDYAFLGCSSLASASLPSATSIGSSAFQSCSSLASADLPSATSIGDYAFSGCSSLASASLPSATSIGSSAFSGCSSLESADLPLATSIGSRAFYGCPSLASANLPSATSIGDYAFAGCESLEEAIIPKVESIGNYVFGYIDNYDENDNWAPRYCKSLVHVDLSSVKSIESEAFYNCSNISSLRIGSAEQWCKVNFGGNPLQSTSQHVDLYIGDSETPATSIELPSTVTEIPNYVFSRTTITSFSAPSATSIGSYAFQGCSSLASANLPSATSIGSSAFYYCSSLASANLPSATSIGSSAFYSCTSLASANLPSATSIGDYAFAGCESLEEAIMPKVESIGYDAFGYSDSYDENGNWDPRYCNSLVHIDLSSVKSIDDDAFVYCSNISSLRIGSAEQWCKVNFGGDCSNPLQVTSQQVDLYIGNSETPATSVELPSTVTEIPDYAFRNTTITSFSAPSATSIGSSAFSGCSSLASASLPSATSIGSFAFSGCSSLASASLPSATSICDYAFSGCSSLASANLPSATSIGSYAFQGCESLEEAIMPKVEIVGECAFYFSRDFDGSNWHYRYCTSLKKIDLPSATSIGSNAFYNCSTLQSINIPAAETLGNQALYYCDKITHLELPEVKEIGEWSLGGMSALEYLSIPKIEKIGGYAFDNTCNIDTLRIGSAEQYCNIEYSAGKGSNGYESAFPLRGDYNKYIFIGDSETPVTEITIPATVQKVPEYSFRGTSIHTIHFEGENPPALISTNAVPEWTMLAVPDEAYETYLAADEYNTIPLQITKEGLITENVTVDAKAGTSDLLIKVGTNNVRHIVNLTVKGTINSYDMLIIRNQMTSLRNLDLTEASIVDCDYVYSNTGGSNYHSVKDVVTADWMNGLMNVKLPSTTKSIDYRAFYNCYKLVSVNVPDGVTSIGGYAFYGCNRIKDLSLPQSVTSFGSYAFTGCTGLREVVIPDGVTAINSYAFNECRDLEKVTIPASVKEIGRSAFSVSKPITLNISSIEEWKDINFSGYYWDGGAFRNVENLYIGNSAEPFDAIVIPEGTTRLKNYTFAGFNCIKSVTFPAELNSIGDYTFSNCSGISSISLPDSLSYIGSYAFYNSGLKEINIPEKIKAINGYTFCGCGNLEKIEFTDSLKSIGSYAFASCYKLAKIELPSYLSTIGSYAFENCSGLEEILIPASITEIQDYAFQGCAINKVIAVTVEPIAINQNTFSTYRTASVYSPRTSYWKYYWNTQWNQFLSINEYGKRHRYKYFYLRGHNGENKEDFEIDDETGTIHGTEDEATGEENAPDADFGEESGIVVGGEQVQELGDIHIHHNGNNGASVITKQNGKVHIDNLYVDIKTQPNRWYFFCFPFDINPSDVKFGGSHVWYLYDGEARAMNGNGGWKRVAADGVMKSGNGYIFQGAVNGTLSIHVADVTIDASDSKTNMITYQSENKNDASWNLIGNPNIAYYDMDNLDYEAPITVYNNETGNYEAVRPGDDSYEFYPFQAFFVQKPEGKEEMNFDATKKETKNKADKNKAAKSAARARAARKVDAMRKVINLEIVSDADSVSASADRTRIVINPTKSVGYETDCDAAKFVADNIAQIYSLDNEGGTYAINERPMENGIVNIAVKAPKDGFYTISASRLDCGAKLRDHETGEVVDLVKGGYTFDAKATTYTKRFQLILGDEATSVSAPEIAMDAIAVEAGAICVNDANADVKVYSAGGALMASKKGAGKILVPAGVYVVNVNGKSVKVTVKE